jgi:steroid 5-alpha reductase family enzyme
MIAIALAAAAIFLSAWMTLAWWLQMRTGKSGWIDTLWSYGVGIAGVALTLLVPLASDEAVSPRQWLVASLCALWSVRLGTHILLRTLSGGDDPRYAQLKKEWKRGAQRRMFGFLQIQALCAFVLAFGIFVAAQNPAPGLRVSDWIGAALLLAAIAGAGAADRQLRAFLADKKNRGKVADIGLWSYSRHPNYFFEWLGWFAYALIAFDSSGSYWWWPLALIAPAMMYWLLVHASGIPPLEAHMLRSRGEAFRDYQRRVNAFFPGPPRQSGNGRPRQRAR